MAGNPPPDALSKGGIVKINTDLLKDFATMNLQGFLDDVKASKAVKDLVLFADGGSGGQSPDGSYNEALAGNIDKGKLDSAKKLRADFTKFADQVRQHVVSLEDLAKQMQVDLKMVATVVENSNDEADITAAEMTADIANLGYGSGSGSKSGKS